MLLSVIDPLQAMQPDAPILNENIFTVGVQPKPTKLYVGRAIHPGNVEGQPIGRGIPGCRLGA